MYKHASARLVRLFLLLSLGVSTLLSGALWLCSYASILLPLALLILTIDGWLLGIWLARRGQGFEWLWSIALINLLLVVPELSLRLIDFHYESGIDYGVLRPEMREYFVADSDLHWRLPTSEANVNSLGFPGREIVSPKPDSVLRMMFLGDSRVQQGYPLILERLLNDLPERGPRWYECVCMGIAGYSSYQGMVAATKYADLVDPDLVVVDYGWNDHWQAYGAIDSEAKPTALTRALSDAVHESRLLQLVIRFEQRLHDGGGHQVLDQVRVPPDQFRENLEAISRQFDSKSIPVIMLTAPTSQYINGVPEYLIAERFAPDAATALVRHRQYDEIVREVAVVTPDYLLDLAAELDTANNVSDFFMSDGIHYSLAGMERVSELIVDFIVSHHLLETTK